MSNLEIVLMILSGLLLSFVIILCCAYSEQYNEVEELKRKNNNLENEKTLGRLRVEERDCRLHIKIRQLERNEVINNFFIEDLKDRLYTRNKTIEDKDKIIESLNAKIIELQNQINQWFTPKVSKNDENNNKPSLVKTFKKRKPIIKAFRYDCDDVDYLKQKLEELDVKIIIFDFISGSISIVDSFSKEDEKFIVKSGQYIVREDGNLIILNSNDFKRFYEEE